MRVAEIRVGGQTEHGTFEGRLNFPDGLIVVSADNHYGKSLAVTAIAWCLGLEAMFGVKDDDPSAFPLAVRDVIDLGEHRNVRVISSFAELSVHHASRLLKLCREIVGNSREVVVTETVEGAAKTIRLNARHRTMKDGVGGLQHYLFELLGFPRMKLVNNRGDTSEIYLENIMPLAYIDQREGWASIQALQVFRYGTLDISAASVEYVLGADEALKNRFELQKSSSTELRLKGAATSLAEQVTATFARHGWPVEWSARGSVREIAIRWARVDLLTVAKRDFSFDLSSEQLRLSERVKSIARTAVAVWN